MLRAAIFFLIMRKYSESMHACVWAVNCARNKYFMVNSMNTNNKNNTEQKNPSPKQFMSILNFAYAATTIKHTHKHILIRSIHFFLLSFVRALAPSFSCVCVRNRRIYCIHLAIFEKFLIRIFIKRAKQEKRDMLLSNSLFLSRFCFCLREFALLLLVMLVILCHIMLSLLLLFVQFI